MRLLTEWLQKTTGIPADLYDRVFTSLTIILVLWLVRRLILKAVWRRTENSRIRYQWRKISNYTAVTLGLLFLGRIWFQQFESVMTFLGLLSAGLAIAMKDPLVNVAGWLFILWRRPFDVGDRIQIGPHAGDVIDIRVFQFTLTEIGNWVHADQCTGRIVHIPNGKVFSDPQVNYTKGWFDYIWNELPVLVTFESNWQRAKAELQQIATDHAGHLTPLAERKLKESSREFIIVSPSLAPTVYTSVEESGVLLTLRYLCEPRRRREGTQQLWEAILERFAACDDIDFAYPTTRYYANTVEGKAGARATPELPPESR
ncbi:mechanosensitive ion channel protein MscS [Geotalea uraniireducens]|uniref:Mechanosensitive ion channel protein MscS n=1 Tax=Geotalea uraniireducens TaxID=351604 RepID=A0ABM8EKG5_9BACT|nr:mechanosensitive ion channel family protein [Geotalea uraniireducens]BDV42987.1 mechanosensitive ion channel protein MscS [Geotalea uraniireducens]